MIKVGQLAPDFTMESTKGTLSLSGYKGKWLILFFYPKDFTFVCPTEITGFSDSVEDFKKLGAELIAVSTDSVESHNAWIKMSKSEGGLGEVNIPIASDQNHKVSDAYDVLIEEKGIALRGLFIIDPDGILRYSVVQDLSVGRNTDETLRVLSGLQAVMKTPNGVCPLNWKPGQELLKTK